MTQQGYRPGEEGAQWWKVAHHLDEAQLASVNAMASNVDDPTIILAFQETIRQAQAILLEIFRVKGLLPAAIEPPAVASAPIDPGSGVSMPPMPLSPMRMSMPPPMGMSMPAPPPGMSMPMPPMGMSMPLPPMMASAFDPAIGGQPFDPFDPASVQTSTDVEPIAGSGGDDSPAETPPQEHVEPSVGAPDVTVPEVSAQLVEAPEAEA